MDPSTQRTNANPNDDDLFSEALNLEDKYYAEGYKTGTEDGSRAGRIEGRTFGLEQAFTKFSELGRLGGRAAVWDARLSPSPRSDASGDVGGGAAALRVKGSDRLRRQVERLVELTDPESLSTVNDEESVNAFDERLREARAKATLVSKMAGEKEAASSSVDIEGGSRGGKGKGGAGGEMEDFAGMPMGKGKE